MTAPSARRSWPTTWRCAARSGSGSPARRSCWASSSTTSSDRARHDHRRACAGLGAAACRRARWWAYRLSVVRGFATYLHALDPALPSARRGSAAAAAAAGQPVLVFRRRDRGADRGHRLAAHPAAARHVRTLIGLLAVTGIRVGEAIALDRGDVDLPPGGSRCGTASSARPASWRCIPAPSTRCAATSDSATGCTQRRARPALFVSTAGHPAALLQRPPTFHRLVRRAGLTPRSASCRPRIHDLRHSFAVATLLDAYAPAATGSPADAAVDLAGSRPPGQHLLVPVRRHRS